MKRKILERIKYWLQIFLIPIYWLSYISPRSKKIWVMGSTFGNRWADNGRYFYLYLSQFEKENIRAIWISRKKEIVAHLNEHGYEAYYVRSVKGIFYCLRAKVYAFDNYSKDICFWLSGGALKVNMWHGVGNKKINHDNRFDYLRHPRNLRERFSTAITRMSNEKPSHFIVATSPMYVEEFSRAFLVPKSHMFLSGYPRNSVLLNPKLEVLRTPTEQKNLNMIVRYKEKGKRIVVYMPTFRASETKFFDVMNLEIFNEFLRQNNIVFMSKMHPKSKVKEMFEKAQYSHIVNICSEVDPYTFLQWTDMLVTDYSSILSDYSLLDKPIITFPYDIENYSNDSRDSALPFEEYIKTTKVYNMEELMENILGLLKEDIDKKERQSLVERTFSCQDGMAGKQLKEAIEQIIYR